MEAPATPPARGRFITLEGGEGAEEIRALLVTGEPGRWLPLTEAILHHASRHEHLARTIRPALAQGIWVLCDRFADSTLAYQGYGLGVDRQALADLHRIAVDGTTPDLTLILDMAPEAGIARTTARLGDEDRYERMEDGFHARLRQGFLEIAAAEPQRCALIDASGPVEAVHARILATLDARLGDARLGDARLGDANLGSAG